MRQADIHARYDYAWVPRGASAEQDAIRVTVRYRPASGRVTVVIVAGHEVPGLTVRAGKEFQVSTRELTSSWADHEAALAAAAAEKARRADARVRRLAAEQAADPDGFANGQAILKPLTALVKDLGEARRDRARHLYWAGAVKLRRVEVAVDGVLSATASVHGGSRYKVTMTVHPAGEGTAGAARASCTCPDAAGWSHSACKHVGAAAYTLYAAIGTAGTAEHTTVSAGAAGAVAAAAEAAAAEAALRGALEQLPKTELVHMLLETAAGNKALRRRLAAITATPKRT